MHFIATASIKRRKSLTGRALKKKYVKVMRYRVFFIKKKIHQKRSSKLVEKLTILKIFTNYLIEKTKELLKHLEPLRPDCITKLNISSYDQFDILIGQCKELRSRLTRNEAAKFVDTIGGGSEYSQDSIKKIYYHWEVLHGLQLLLLLVVAVKTRFA